MRNKFAFWIITISLSLLLVYTLVNTVILPVFTKSALPKTSIRVLADKQKADKSKQIIQKDIAAPVTSGVAISKETQTKLLDLRKKDFLLQSKLALASEDSMYLILDLVNHTALLEIKGITLHECRILDLEISNSIKAFGAEALLSWMGQPFNVKHVDATIPKISFIEKIAPKDTLEANKNVVEPTIHKLDDIYLVMEFDRNLRLVISQSEKPDEEGQKLISALRWKYSKIEIQRSVQSLTKFNREPVKPQINIVLPKSDATILYKALPLKLRMILKM